MKNKTLIIICTCAIALSSCFHRDRDIRVSVKETEDVYRFTATFPENKTRKVEQLISKSISPVSLFGDQQNYVDVNTILEDKTRIYIKASPGNIKIQLDKYDNSDASYQRVKDMCEEIKRSLTD